MFTLNCFDSIPAWCPLVKAIKWLGSEEGKTKGLAKMAYIYFSLLILLLLPHFPPQTSGNFMEGHGDRHVQGYEPWTGPNS